MSTLTFDVALFRSQFPAFADETAYPDATLQAFFDVATCYVSDVDCGRLMGACRQYALNAMTAHLVFISDLAGAGGTPAFVTSTTIGSVSVSVQPNQNTDQWTWWLNLSPYGSQLVALLAGAAIGGILVGGSPERSPFRQVGGGFI